MCRSHTSGRHQLCRMLLQWDDDSKVMMIHSGTTVPPPTHPTKDNAHLDIFSNIRFSPKLCRWALNRKTWRDSGELWSKIICWTISLTIWRAMQAWMKTTVLETYAGMLGDPNYNTVVRNKLKLRGASAGLSMKMEQFFSMDNCKTRCGQHESEVSSTDHAHLNNLGVGKQTLLPHGDFQVGELMD